LGGWFVGWFGEGDEHGAAFELFAEKRLAGDDGVSGSNLDTGDEARERRMQFAVGLASTGGAVPSVVPGGGVERELRAMWREPPPEPLVPRRDDA